MAFTDKYETIKRSVIILWILGSGVVFWIATFLPQSFDEKGFVNHLLFFFGGGFAFHFLTEIIKAPISESSWPQWKKVARHLLLAVVAVYCVFGFVLLAKSQREVLTTAGSFLLAIATILVGTWIVISCAEKAHGLFVKIQEIESANKVPQSEA